MFTASSGLDRITWNVLTSWGCHLVLVVAGFLFPRYVDGQLGQAALGVWDFAWSLVGYLGMAQVGVGSSVNRYVAKYGAADDTTRLNRALSSVMCIQVLAAGVVFLVTLLAAWLIPSLLSSHLGELVTDARWVVLLLGTSIGLEIAFDTYDGILTGCHRWDLHNVLIAVVRGGCVVAMVISLYLGGGLRAMAVIYCCGTALSGAAFMRLAYVVCPGLQVRLGLAEWAEAWRMFTFGGKTFINVLSNTLLYRTSSVIIVTYLGPAALAHYSRPMALAQHVGTFVAKFAYVLTPIASHMDAAGSRGDVQRLFNQTVRYSAFLTLPPILGLVMLGGPILRLWMGKSYEQGGLVAVLAASHLLTFAHRPILSVLTGMGMHKRPALYSLVGAITSVGICILALGPLHGGLLCVAGAVSISLVAVDGIIIPIYACRTLGLRPMRFLLSVWRQPVMYAVPFAAWLAAARLWPDPAEAVAVGAVGGGLLIGGIYWKWVVPAHTRDQITGMLQNLWGERRPGPPRAHEVSG